MIFVTLLSLVPTQAMVNHTIVHMTCAVPYDFKKQTAPAAILTPPLFLTDKSLFLQIMDCSLDRADRKVQPLAMVPIAGQQVPSLSAWSCRYKKTAMALWGRAVSYIFLSYSMLNPNSHFISFYNLPSVMSDGFSSSFHFCACCSPPIFVEEMIVTIHGLGAAHSNDSGRYSKFCFAKIAPHS